MLRKTIFWIHLFCGIIAGVVIAVMCFTGVILAFEKEIVAWFDRGPRLVAVPEGAQDRVPLDQLISKVKELKPDAKISSVVIQPNPKEAILLSAGKTENYYANPYTGEIKEQTSHGSRRLMEVMISWHRWLAREGDSRPMGKAITGACNVAFLFLAVSGLFLWFPRRWSANAIRSVLALNFRLKGKARDWNWHNALGFWSAPVLIVLTLTATIISYRWASDMVYKATGTTPPPSPGASPAPGSAPALNVVKPAPDAKPLTLNTLIAAVQKQYPGWDQISYRMPGGGGGGGRNAGGTNAIAKAEPSVAAGPKAAGEAKGNRPADQPGRQGGEQGSKSQPTVISVRDAELNPEFTVVQVSLNPFTGEILKTEGYSDYNTGRKVRTWMRFLHTGEALGIPGKAIAGIGSAVGLVLVYTGFALSWRRFLGRRNNHVGKEEPATKEIEQPMVVENR